MQRLSQLATQSDRFLRIEVLDSLEQRIDAGKISSIIPPWTVGGRAIHSEDTTTTKTGVGVKKFAIEVQEDQVGEQIKEDKNS